MNIVYYSSDFFSEMCGVSMESLCEHNTEEDQIMFYVVEDHISDRNKARLKQITDRFSRELVFISAPSQKDVYPDIKMDLGRTFLRMSLGEILPPEVERVLSLDSDTLTMDSLHEMYNTELAENEYVAGVYDCVGAGIQKKVLRAPDDLQYCNAGMFLIDLKKWRTENVGRKLVQAVLGSADGKNNMFFLEQDLMNLTFYRHLKVLGPKYNLLTSIYYFDYDEVMCMKRPVVYYDRETVERAKKKPALLHATSCFYFGKRMWVENSDHPYAEFYSDYRGRTPWRDDARIQDPRKTVKKLYTRFWHSMPRRWAVKIASQVINHIRPAYARITQKMKVNTLSFYTDTKEKDNA